MTDPRHEAPRVLVTTRVRGGASATVGAVVLAGVLGLVVWIGISGRVAPVVPTRAPVVALLASPSPSVTAHPVTTPEPVITSTPEPTLPPAEVAIESDDLSITATLGNRQFMTWLRPVKPGHLSGTFGMPIPPPTTKGTLELEQVWRTVAEAWSRPSRNAWETLATWDLSLEPLAPGSGDESVLLDQFVPARPAVHDLSMLVTRGYRITVRAQGGVPRGQIIVDVHLASGHERLTRRQ